MERKNFELYKNNIEVIMSMPKLPSMYDEIYAFSVYDNHPILNLLTLQEALNQKYVTEIPINAKSYEEIELLYQNCPKKQVPQIITELITLHLEEAQEAGRIVDKTIVEKKVNNGNREFYDPTHSFRSNLTVNELCIIAEKLVEAEFIEVEKIDTFVNAFSDIPLKGIKKIKWLKQYKNKSDNICLGILLNYIAKDELCDTYKAINQKVYKVFDTTGGVPKYSRTFENSLRELSKIDREETQNSLQFKSILGL